MSESPFLHSSRGTSVPTSVIPRNSLKNAHAEILRQISFQRASSPPPHETAGGNGSREGHGDHTGGNASSAKWTFSPNCFPFSRSWNSLREIGSGRTGSGAKGGAGHPSMKDRSNAAGGETSRTIGGSETTTSSSSPPPGKTRRVPESPVTAQCPSPPPTARESPSRSESPCFDPRPFAPSTR